MPLGKETLKERKKHFKDFRKIVRLVPITLKKELVVIDIIIVTQIESMTDIPDTNPEIQKTHTAHTCKKSFMAKAIRINC